MVFWKQILSKLEANQHVYLLTVIQSSGSSPGRQGFKMMVAQDGFISGSIGGGIMEYTLAKEAKELVVKKKPPLSLFKKQVHRKKAPEGSGMICSGEQTVVFHLLNDKSKQKIERIIKSLETNKKCILTLSPDSIDVVLD